MLTKEKIKSLIIEFNEKGTVLVCGTIQDIETFIKYLSSETSHFEETFENGCTRFTKSEISYF